MTWQSLSIKEIAAPVERRSAVQSATAEGGS